MTLKIDIVKYIGDKQLNKNFKLNNEILIFYGPSGSGKTTILNSIAGLNIPDKGIIKLNNNILFSFEKNINIPSYKRNIGYIFQDYALFPHLNVFNNVIYSKKNKSIDKDKLNYLFNRCQIDDFKHRYPDTLSGGEKQRVALARALYSEPELLLLDEPLSSVDSNLKIMLLNEIKSIQKDWQIPFIYVTHSMKEARFLGSNILRFGDKKEVNINEYKENIS